MAPTVLSFLIRSLGWHFDKITGLKDAVCLAREVFQNMTLNRHWVGRSLLSKEKPCFQHFGILNEGYVLPSRTLWVIFANSSNLKIAECPRLQV